MAAFACGAPPVSGPPVAAREAPRESEPSRRGVDVPDDCEQRPGEPPPEPLRIPYDGVAKAARCQREVYTIMGGVTHFLGVPCKHCHTEPDYAADTHNKQVANWMARELTPRLRKASSGAEVWCKDCHAGKPKLLGNPRRKDVAIDWMTTHLTDDFATLSGKPPKCKECHGGDLGSPEFRAKVILQGELGLPAPPTPPPAASGDAHAPSAPSVSPPVPDFGKR